MIRDRLRPSPFVVLADMTIGLSFILIVFSLSATFSNSQILYRFTRDERQKKSDLGLFNVIKASFPKATFGYRTAAGDSREHMTVQDPQGPIAYVWSNGSFQRLIVVRPLFRRGSDELSPTGRTLYEKLGHRIAHNVADYSYLFLHGVSEAGETGPTKEDGEQLRSLSVARAQRIFRLYQTIGVIAPFGSSSSALFEPKYVIPYGTGSDLYAGQGRVGRVDLVLFYGDVNSEDKE